MRKAHTFILYRRNCSSREFSRHIMMKIYIAKSTRNDDDKQSTTSTLKLHSNIQHTKEFTVLIKARS